MSSASTDLQPTAATLERVVEQFQAARNYMLQLVESLTPEQWFWTPAQPTTHIAWQVGHLAVAQYGLMLFRQRGRQPVDTELMSGEFRKLFMKGTNPSDSATNYPQPQEILSVLQRVHQQAIAEVREFEPARLGEPTEPPHAGPPTRLGSLLFAPLHEMIHAGQIGLLRRLQGLDPLR